MGKKATIVFVILALALAGCSRGNSPLTIDANLPGALNLVLGTTDKPGVFSSYHLELTEDAAQLNDDGTAVINQTTQISADVEGKNIHIFQTDAATSQTKEGYILGDTEFKIVSGQKQDTLGMIAVAWAMWPLQVVVPYAYASNWAKKTGTDTIDGRSADVYAFDSSEASAANQAVMATAGLNGFANAKGQVWIDKQTGAMLKLNMTYTQSFTNNDGKLVGSGTGNIALEITQVNQVHVVAP